MLVWWRNKVPNGDLTEEGLGGRIRCFPWSVGRFSELRDPDNAWVSLSVAPVHARKSPADILYGFRANVFASYWNNFLLYY